VSGAGRTGLIPTLVGCTFMKQNPTEHYPVEKSDDEWKRELSTDQFCVLREHGTERAGTSPLNKEYREGTFRCAACDQPLFESGTKFDSGTGRPIEGAVGTTEDNSHLMRRVEVHCSRCGSHLGHVFPDGPKPTGERYCMNGLSLKFEPTK
jgi:peptide-methionine (R)-S-oxide reductase